MTKIKFSALIGMAKSMISEPGTWCINTPVHMDSNGKKSYCAIGAIVNNTTIYCSDRMQDVQDALFEVLKKRYQKGLLPIPVYGGGGSAPIDWDTLFRYDTHIGSVIAQFNNSSTQEAVLALFDEAIAEAIAVENQFTQTSVDSLKDLLKVNIPETETV